MSGKLSALMMSACLVAVAAAMFKAEENGRSYGRQPASKKELILGEFRSPSAVKHTEKLKGPLETQIEIVGARPEKAGDLFVLKGLLVSNENIQNVKFKWAIPKGLEVVSGDISGTVAALEANVPVPMQITLRQLTDDNQQIHLSARARNNGTRFGHTTQYNSLIQDIIEAGKKELFESTKQQARRDSVKGKQKVFH